METYTFLRTFADSWHLLFMFLFFIGMVIFIFRPGAKKVHDETSNMIFRNDDKPASPETDRQRSGQGDTRSEPREAR
ncbi:MAG: cbb3-type cytochrome c oxidase subunit 3 [Rhodobacteraceae bacterium]|nr:cbb3-type cytochrome c oxidase subunit 3 [Paracoccaceae bacterium]